MAKAVAEKKPVYVKIFTGKVVLQDKPQHYEAVEMSRNPGNYLFGKDKRKVSFKMLEQMGLDKGVDVTHGMLITDPNKLDFLYANPLVAESRKKYNSDREDFWIDDPEKEATVDIESDELMFQAMKVINDLDSVGKEDLAIYVGIDPRIISKSQLMSALYKRAKRNESSADNRRTGAYAIVDFGDENKTKEVSEVNFIKKLLHFHLIKKEKGRYYFENIPLGYSEMEAFVTLSEEGRKDLKDRLERDLINKQK